MTVAGYLLAQAAGQQAAPARPTVQRHSISMGGCPLKDGSRLVGGVGEAGAVSGPEDVVIAQQAARAFALLLKNEGS